MKACLLILLGAAVGTMLFLIGDADDSPGLSFIGLAAAFLLMMRGVYHTGIIRTGYYIPVILFTFGAVSVLFPIVLYFDGEKEGLWIVAIAGNTAGILLLAGGVVRVMKARKEKSRSKK